MVKSSHFQCEEYGFEFRMQYKIYCGVEKWLSHLSHKHEVPYKVYAGSNPVSATKYAPLVQLEETIGLSPIQCEFESHGEYNNGK